MSWDDFKDKPTKEEEAKKPIYRSTGQGYYFCILRVGKRFKQIGNIKNFERHMERQMQVANANNSIKNEIIIGSSNVTEDVKLYLEGINIRSNNVLATELLLTASPGFFRGMPKQELNKWIDINRRWLEKEFGTNLQYAVLHLDEST